MSRVSKRSDVSNLEMTQRELQVAKLIVKGLSNAAIAKKLGLKEKSVKFHITSIYRICYVKSRSEFMAQFYTTNSFYPFKRL